MHGSIPPHIVKILNTHHIPASAIMLHKQSGDNRLYIADDRYVLKISPQPFNEVEKLKHVQTLTPVPKFYASGVFNVASGTPSTASNMPPVIHYLLVEYKQGQDLWDAAQNLTVEDQRNIGQELAGFLRGLHAHCDILYDIGHYIPTIPRFAGSWKDGHLTYIKYLQQALSTPVTQPRSQVVINEAFQYMYQHIDTLDYQAGARLLHNDLHPKNIVVHEGKLTGVIDWECAQYGEADFDLVNLFHWCIYPDTKGIDLAPLLQSLLAEMHIIQTIPDFAQRMTIYQLEHDLNQLIWNGPAQEDERIRRITGWLTGAINPFTTTSSNAQSY